VTYGCYRPVREATKPTAPAFVSFGIRKAGGCSESAGCIAWSEQAFELSAFPPPHCAIEPGLGRLLEMPRHFDMTTALVTGRLSRGNDAGKG
jgi:hypothetical protein